MKAEQTLPSIWLFAGLMAFVGWVCFDTEWFEKRHSFDDFKLSSIFGSHR